ncbi:hypothetical protein VW35_17855 [Devosia soli]|uniref:Uncharacterized protein n=1 Tax=Devosia soli TaxID=361041 RepID=A0A0F5L2K1_9HYPH|nr:hypothetical protein [Devosia soli]KKB76631.1 hypothetical protein VW35_17855 [Devosia soli]
MSSTVLSERNVILRLEFSIADAVHQRGLLPVIASALSAWWHRPRVPSQLPAYLRDDVGLPPVAEPIAWHSLPTAALIPHRPRRRVS